MKTTTIKQKNLTAECWKIQAFGIDHCKTCEFRPPNKKCGGLNILKTGKNRKDIEVPIGKNNE